MPLERKTGQGIYDEKSISVLEPMEAIRKRPGMYIGNTGQDGLHHLPKEAIDNALDEAIIGAAKRCVVTLHPDCSVSVSDDGRGIPVGLHPQAGTAGIPPGMSTLQVVLSIPHAGGKFDTTESNSGYKFQRSGAAAGLHGIGVKAITALSAWTECAVRRDGKLFETRFERGKCVEPVHEVRPLDPGEKTGTTISFLPDEQIFESLDWVPETIAERLEDVAYLCPGLETVLQDDRDPDKPKTKKWKSNEGLVGLLRKASKGRELLFDPLTVSAEEKTLVKRGSLKDREVVVVTHVHFGYVKDSDDVTIRSYANNVSTGSGGSHVRGFEAALFEVAKELVADDPRLRGIKAECRDTDAKEGIIAVISVYLPEPEFLGQTKDKLGNVEVREVVRDSVAKALNEILATDAAARDAMKERVVQSILARDAAAKAREGVARKTVFERISLPGKLADCTTKDVHSSELWIVEGESAAGSAKKGRNVLFQAILGLKGKVLNVHDQVLNRALENKEIKDLMTAIGLKIAIDKETNTTRLQCQPRYGKLILAMDADPDGDHIQCLLLTFFYKFAPETLRDGMVWLSAPPLYRASKKGTKWSLKTATYLRDDEKLAEWSAKVDVSKYDVSRFKGLGEMDYDELGWTTMNPANRVVVKVTLEDAARAAETFQILMGDSAAARKNFIEQHAAEIEVEL